MTEWKELLLPSVPVAEIVIRGVIIYISLLFLIRVILRREAGTVGTADLLLIVLIGDAAQNGMASDHRSIGDAVLLVTVLITCNYTLDWLAYRFPSVERIIQPRALPLVKNGQIQWRNMRRELITKDELFSHLREQGISDLSEVKQAMIESDGRISVLKKEGEPQKQSSNSPIT